MAGTNHRSGDGGAGWASPGDLAARLSESARQMQEPDDPDETLRAVVTAAVALIPGAAHGSISLIRDRKSVQSVAPSSPLASTIDALQDETGEGPCLDSMFECHTVRVPDTAREKRWPLFSARAAEAGAGSMMSLQLFVDGDSLGALNLYAGQAGAFDEESEHVGQLFASHAAIAFSSALQQSHLQRAVGTRETIGQAQGILMERHKVDADRAFAMLVVASQHRNVKLRDVAEQLVRTGTLGDEDAS